MSESAPPVALEVAGLRSGYHGVTVLKGLDFTVGDEIFSVLGANGFCASCHAYAAVKLDCFECHTPLRQAGAAGKADTAR